jgi:hypothetical protein
MVGKEMGVWYALPDSYYINIICNSNTISYTGCKVDPVTSKASPWDDMLESHYKVGPEELVTW